MGFLHLAFHLAVGLASGSIFAFDAWGKNHGVSWQGEGRWESKGRQRGTGREVQRLELRQERRSEGNRGFR